MQADGRRLEQRLMRGAEAKQEVWQSKHLLSAHLPPRLPPRHAGGSDSFDGISLFGIRCPCANTDYALWPKARLVTNPADQVAVSFCLRSLFFPLNELFTIRQQSCRTACRTTSGDYYLQTSRVFLAWPSGEKAVPPSFHFTGFSPFFKKKIKKIK